MASHLYRLLGLGPKRVPPPIDPTDEVAPLHFFDDTPTLRPFTLMWTFRFDEVLDADKLGSSLAALFQMEGWRKLGGRIRLRPDKSAEIHIPRPFTEERPPLYFTKAHFDVRMSEHPEASKLPSASAEKLGLFPSPRHYHALGVGPGAPRCIDDYLYSDRPLFSLHVITFTDGTLVSVTFNHIISDLAGFMAVLKAWQLVLAGKPEEVPPFKGFSEDTMAGLYMSDTTETSVLAHKQLSFWGFAAFGLRLLFESWWNSPIDSNLICVPSKTMDALVRAARDQVPQSGTEPSFISENDIIVALATRAVAGGLSPGRPITVLQAVDPRSRVKSVFQQDAAYVCNAPAAIFVHYDSQEAVDGTIGELALEARKALLEQVTEDQMKAVAGLAYQCVMKTGNPPVFGARNATMLVFSNWSKGKFHETVDFSPAIVKSASEHHPQRKPGHPVYYHSQSIEKPPLAPNVIVIQGRDPEGNYWLNSYMPSRIWPAFLKEFEKYA